MGDEHGENTVDHWGTDPGAQEPAYAGHDDLRGATWQPVDLKPYLDGTVVRTPPSIGWARADGLKLLYAGKEHLVIGEMESGKSWFAAACAAAELTNGQPVIYIHFEEADPTDTVERLRALGVPDDTIAADLAFIGPNEPADPFTLAALLNEKAPSLVILDGINEAMSLHGQAIREEDGVATFRRRLVKPFTAVEAAVLGCDHVVKDRERRDRTPLGSIHKGNGLTGSLILLENAVPFGRGSRGVSHVFVTKDRPGFLRAQGRPGKQPGKTYMGSLIVDDTRTYRQYLDLALVEPQDESPEESGKTSAERDDDRVLSAITALITETGAMPPQRVVEAKVTGISRNRTRDALTRLVLDGRLVEHDGSRRSRLYGLPTVPQSPAQ